jgi:hypothetical protein
MLVKLDGASINVNTNDFSSTLVRGGIENQEKINISGFTQTLATAGSSKTLWTLDSEHYQPTNASQLYIKSSSANDTSGGTGARTLELIGVTTTKAVATETITLNGTNPVQTTNSYFTVYNFSVTSVGSNGSNVGNIKAYVSDENTEIVNYINATENNSSLCIYRVPTGKTLIIQNIIVNGQSNGCNMHLKTKNTNNIEFSEFVFRISGFGRQIDFTIDKTYTTDNIIYIKLESDSDLLSANKNCAISVILNGILFNSE